MSKQLNNQRYIFRIEAGRININKDNYKFNPKYIKRDIKDRIIVGIGESTGLKMVRDILNRKEIIEDIEYEYGSEEHINKLKELYNEKKKEDIEDIKTYKKELKNLSNKILLASLQDGVCNIDFSNDKSGKLWNKYSKQGFKINGEKFKLLLGTPGGIKKSIVLFVKEQVYDEMDRRLNNGADYSKKPMLTSKLMAYKALTFSASNKVEFKEDKQKVRVAVVKDIERTLNNVKVTNIRFDKEDREIKVTPTTKDVVINCCDGCGLIHPDLAKLWSIRLGILKEYEDKNGNKKEKGYISSGYCIRNAWTKGMVTKFDFRKYYKELIPSGKLIDVWGNELNIDEVDLILNQSMLKLNKPFYNSVDEWLENCRNNGHLFSVTKYIPEIEDEERMLNYQYLQCLDLSEEDIDNLINKDVEEIKEVLNGDGNKAIIYSKGKYINSKNVWETNKDCYDNDNYVRALMIDRELLNDPYIKDRLRRAISKRIDRLKTGKINVKGNYQIAIGEPMLQLTSMAHEIDETIEIKGILQENEFYIQYWRDKGIKEVGMFRSPMSCRENTRRVKVCDREEADIYKDIKNMIIFNGYDTTMMAMNGEDFDGDMNFTTSNEIIIKGITNLPAIDCDSEEALKTTEHTRDKYLTSIKDAFGNKVGSVTNFGSSCYDKLSTLEKGSKEYKELERRIQCIQWLQQSCIDSAKLGKPPEPIPSHWNTFRDWKNRKVKDEQELKELMIEFKIINEEDEIELTKENVDNHNKEAEFNLSILVENKPYYFRYIYNESNKTWLTYSKRREKVMKNSTMKSWEEVEQSNNRTQEEQEIFEIHTKKNPFSCEKGIVNIIANKVEKYFKEEYDKKLISIKGKEFDFTKYVSESYKENVNSVDYKKYVKKIKEIYEEYKKYIDDKKDTSDKEEGAKDTQEIYFQLKNSLLEEFKSVDLMLDILINCSYEKSIITPSFVWSVAGEELIERLLDKNNRTISFLVKDENGTIEFSGETFKIETKKIEKEEEYNE